MYTCGNLVLYGIHGVCRVLGTQTQSVNKKQIEYYILEPVEQAGTRYYIPTQNQTAVAKLQPIITRQELDALLRSDDAAADAWIVDENQRKQRYRDLITSGDRASLICMVRALYRKKQEQQAAGKKLHLCDENFLKDAQKLLDTEFSMVLGISQDEVGEYIQNMTCCE